MISVYRLVEVEVEVDPLTAEVHHHHHSSNGCFLFSHTDVLLVNRPSFRCAGSQPDFTALLASVAMTLNLLGKMRSVMHLTKTED